MPDLPKSAPETFSMGDIYYLLFRHKGKILFFSFLGVLAAVAVFFLTPPVYRSEASLLVRYVTDTTVLDSASMGERITSPARGGENLINSEIEILLSYELVEKVLDDMGFSQFMPTATNRFDRARTAAIVRSRINIEVPKSSNIINVSFDGPDPTVSQDFLKRLIDAYLQKHIEIHRAAGAYEFLSQQTDQLRTRLSETEEELRKLKYSEGVVSIEETKRNISVRTEDLTNKLGELESAFAAAKARVDIMRPLSMSVPGRTSLVWVASATNEAARALESKLQRLRQRENELLATYTADSIPVKGLREQIKDAERQLAGETPSMVTNSMTSGGAAPDSSAAFLEAQANLAELQARIAVQKDFLARTLDEAKKIDAVENKIVQLQRNKELQEANYKYFCQSLEHARIDEALNTGRISNIGIVQSATLPSEKMRVKLPRNMAMALLLGVLAGLGLAGFQEYFHDQTLRKSTELQAAFRVPVLMTVPLQKGVRKYLKERQGGPLLLSAANESEGEASVRKESERRTDLNDYYEVLRDRLISSLGPMPSGPCVLGVTSCSRGAGVSTLAAGLALAFARGGEHRVVLVNGDTESLIPQIFGVNPVTGLTEMVADAEGNTAVTQHNHFVVPSRDTVPPATPAGYAPRFAALIQHLRNSKAGFVIIDLPPVSETGLTLRVGRLMDGVVLVIAAENVSRHVAERVKEMMVQADVKIIGTILNKQKQYVPDWVYPTC
jgi:succinoglycan biosynthesis transport protein ExoP